LPWRRRRGELEVALVHRPRYDDWAWAKGKLEPGEQWPVAAVREVFEETGFQVRLGRTLPSSEYSLLDNAGQPTTKRVRYWAAEVVGGDGTLVNEIDEVAWLDVSAAAARLSYDRDHDQLRALVRADIDGTLTTWPLVIVRHARSRSRSAWSDADPLRPLDARGRERADALIPMLAAYGVTRVVTSPSLRCLDTVLPYAVAAGQHTHLKAGLSEEGFAERPDRAPRHLTRLLERGNAAVVCSHGPVLPVLLERLAGMADTGDTGDTGETDGITAQDSGDTDGITAQHSGDTDGITAGLMLSEASKRGLGKGDMLVVHLAGTGAPARVVDVERYPAP